MVDISPDLLQRIKIAAANKDVSKQEYVEVILDQVVPSEKRERGRLNSAAIEDLLETREESPLLILPSLSGKCAKSDQTTWESYEKNYCR